jgi:hypothetical protein
MKSIKLGIDLGTTYSVMAVKGRVDLTPGYPPGEYLAECDVTVIPTPEGDYLFPSVFWAGPDSLEAGSEVVLIGMEAKLKAQEEVMPIMFSKRSIGTLEELRMAGHVFTAQQVATQILKYLKQCAERALGQPIRQAVVTHPAYFDRNQVQETQQAAVHAGFDMSYAEQTMMEPVAAALAYLARPEDPGATVPSSTTVMTYDLGGGTFDVTVLERVSGQILMKSFDGNRLLGGYNFDRRFIDWVLRQLKAQGRVIPYDETSEADRGRRARLLQVAENVKIQLSEARSPKANVPVKIDFLVDAEGKKVLFVGQINQEQYQALIQDLLDETIIKSRRAVEKAGNPPLDLILLVGGSTYGPWVQRAVREAFDVSAEPYHPDLCVAAGAAIQAERLPDVPQNDVLKLVPYWAPRCPLPKTDISGQIRTKDDALLDEKTCSELFVTLTRPDGGTLQSEALRAEGRFLFRDVELLDDEPSEFTLRVSNSQGLTLLTHTFPVEYQIDPEQPPLTVLPKPLYIETPQGYVALAQEGKPLPAKCAITLKRLHGDARESIPILQDFAPVGAITLENLPPDAGEGSLIEIEVEITQKNEMRGLARIKTRTGSIAGEHRVQIVFPPYEVPGLAELQAHFEDLQQQREERMVLSRDPDQRVALAGAGRKIVERIERLLEEQDPDKQELHQALRELDRVVNPPPEDMDPPRLEFRQLVDETRELLAEAGTNEELKPYASMLARIEKDGNDAYMAKNSRKWSLANDSLRQLHQRVVRVMEGGDDQRKRVGSLPAACEIKDWGLQQLESLRSKLRTERELVERLEEYESKYKKRCDDLARAIDQIEQEIEKIDDQAESEQALAQMKMALRGNAKLNKPGAEQIEKKIKEIRFSVEKAG